MAVLSLTTAGLAHGLSAASAFVAAPNPDDRNFSASSSSIPMLAQIVDENGTYNDYNYGGYSYGYAGHWRDIDTGAQYQYAYAQSTSIMGTAQLPQESHGDAYDYAPGGSPDASTGTGMAGTSTDGTVSIGDSSTLAEAHMGDDGNCVPVGALLFQSRTDVKAFDRTPRTFADGTVLDVLDVEGDVAGATTGSMLAVPGSPDRQGVEVSADGSTGTFYLLNRSVKVEILKAATAHLVVDGVNPSVSDVVAATIRVTDASGRGRR